MHVYVQYIHTIVITTPQLMLPGLVYRCTGPTLNTKYELQSFPSSAKFIQLAIKNGKFLLDLAGTHIQNSATKEPVHALAPDGAVTNASPYCVISVP